MWWRVVETFAVQLLPGSRAVHSPRMSPRMTNRPCGGDTDTGEKLHTFVCSRAPFACGMWMMLLAGLSSSIKTTEMDGFLA